MRVLTWNLWWRFGDWRRRQEAIAATLTELRPGFDLDDATPASVSAVEQAIERVTAALRK